MQQHLVGIFAVSWLTTLLLCFVHSLQFIELVKYLRKKCSAIYSTLDAVSFNPLFNTGQGWGRNTVHGYAMSSRSDITGDRELIRMCANYRIVAYCCYASIVFTLAVTAWAMAVEVVLKA